MRFQAQRVGLMVIVGTLFFGSIAPQVKAAPKQRDQIVTLDSAILRDQAGDIARSDGGGTYASEDLQTRSIYDFSPSVTDGDSATVNQDRLIVMTEFGAPRHTIFDNLLASANAGTGQPVPCKSGYFIFESQSTPDWYEKLVTVGDSVNGWGTTGCYTSDTFRYHAYYREADRVLGAGDCLTITKTGENALTVTAPSSGTSPLTPCNAEIYTFDKSSGTWSGSFLGTSDAPFGLTVTLPTVSRGKGKK